MKLSRQFASIPLAITMAAAGIILLLGLGSDTVEARGRSITVTRNDLVTPATATDGGNAPCLQSLVEWEPVGSKLEVEFLLQGRGNSLQSWKIIGHTTQLLPGRAQAATVDWTNVAPGQEYRHLFRSYSLKGKDGSSRNQQLSSEFSPTFTGTLTCPE